MKKCLSLLLLAIFVCAEISAQNLPNSMFVGSVNVRIDGDARSIIEREIDNLNANPKYLNSLVTKMNLYFPIIEKVLAEEGVPDEFKYLCVQESAFNPEAVSTSNAVGYWQFKRETAQEVGMRVDGVVDERKHIAAATKGAAVYLSRSNLILKNWISTLLSYRMGLGAVRRMSDNDWAYKNEITVNSSTDWYVLRFLAYRHFLEKQYNQSKNTANTTYLFEYNNSRGKNLIDIAQELDVPLSDVIVNNAWLKSSSVPDDKDYTVYLPVSNQQYLDLKIKNNQKKFSEDQVSVNQDIGFPVLVKLTELATKNEAIFYEINGKKGVLSQQGDTPESIAERAGINLKRFLKFNDINENDRIIPNEVYYLKKKDRRAVVAYHTVLGYETLWKISQMYGMQMEDLMAKNRITQVQRLQKGRLLWLIETRPEGQSVEYVQSPDDKKIIVMEDTPIITPTPRQPNGQPVKKPVVLPQNTQPEVTVFETKTDQNVGIASTKPVITKSSPSNPSVTTITYPTTTTTTQPTNKPTSTTVYSPPVVTNTSSNSSNKIVKNHSVEPKQTYFSISRMYNMSVDELYSLNDIYSGTPLRIGQNIRVYQSSSSPVTGAVKAGEVVTAIYTYPAENQPPVNKNGTTTTIVREVVTTPSENVGTATVTTTPVAIPSTNSSTTVYQPTPPPTSTVSNNTSTTVYQPTIPPSTVSKPFTPAPTNAKPNYKIIHTIQAGETIYRVSKIYNVTVDNLKQWNNLTENTVEIGQELTIMGGVTKPVVLAEPTPTKTNSTTTVSQSSSSNNTQYHTLQAGETVFRLSKMYGVTVDEIVRWNNIKGFAVSVGQRLVVKK
jgi:membrane-bound lytic murein transglycosylase D